VKTLFLCIAILLQYCLVGVPTVPAAAAETYTLTLTMPAVPAGIGITHQTAKLGEVTATVPASTDQITLDILWPGHPPGAPIESYTVETRFERGDTKGEWLTQRVDPPEVYVPPTIPKPAPVAAYTWRKKVVTRPPVQPPPAGTKKLIDSTSLRLIGGWKVPQTHIEGQRLTMAFTPGGLAVDGKRIYAIHNAGVQEFSAPAMGTGENYNAWPELTPVKFFPDLYAPAVEANKAYAAPDPHGLAMLDGKLHVTGRTRYGSPPPLNGFITREGDSAAHMPAGTTAQKHGGGLCTIPEAFATKYLQGKTVAVGFGGSTSGQGYTAGPSLVAAASIDDPTPIDLIGFGNFDTQDPNDRERRFPDYEKGIEWVLPPKDGVGYWALGKVRAGPVWIDTPNRQGVLYWSTQATGLLSYAPQGEAGGDNRTNKQRLYIYDPDQIALVASGQKKPNDMRAKFYEWTACTPIPSKAGDGTTMIGEVVGACWYADRLYLLHRWITAGSFEPYPIVAVYEIKE